MGRAAWSAKTKVMVAAAAVVVVLAGGAWGYAVTRPHLTTTRNSAHQVTQVSYPGQNGVTAMKLLEKYATVKVKHYSFGDFVTSINGVAGNGPKYWTLYVNNKEANVGASVYKTKNSDTITWKLQ